MYLFGLFDENFHQSHWNKIICISKEKHIKCLSCAKHSIYAMYLLLKYRSTSVIYSEITILVSEVSSFKKSMYLFHSKNQVQYISIILFKVIFMGKEERDCWTSKYIELFWGWPRIGLQYFGTQEIFFDKKVGTIN